MKKLTFILSFLLAIALIFTSCEISPQKKEICIMEPQARGYYIVSYCDFQFDSTIIPKSQINVTEKMPVSKLIKQIGRPWTARIVGDTDEKIELVWPTENNKLLRVYIKRDLPDKENVELTPETLEAALVSSTVSFFAIDDSTIETFGDENIITDYYQLHRPTKADYDRLTEGMTLQEIVSILGDPHCVEWHTSASVDYICTWFIDEYTRIMVKKGYMYPENIRFSIVDKTPIDT